MMSLSFDDIRAAARDKWNADLGRIRVKGGTEDQKKVFYTALYHALIHPNVVSDVNGEYPLMESFGDGKKTMTVIRCSLYGTHTVMFTSCLRLCILKGSLIWCVQW